MTFGRYFEAQLMLTNTRNAFRGQSRSPNMVPFDYVGTILTLSWKNVMGQTRASC